MAGLLSRRILIPASILTFILLIFWTLPTREVPSDLQNNRNSDPDVNSWCPIPERPAIIKDGLKPSFLFIDHKFVEKQVERLSEAVNVPTVSYGDFGNVEKDERFEPFHKFHVVLEGLFPLV
jgi:hypothetical protein